MTYTPQQMDGQHWLVPMPVVSVPNMRSCTDAGGKVCESLYKVQGDKYSNWLSRRILIAPEHVDYFMGKEWPEGSFKVGLQCCGVNDKSKWRECSTTAYNFVNTENRRTVALPLDPGEGKKEEGSNLYKWVEGHGLIPIADAPAMKEREEERPNDEELFLEFTNPPGGMSPALPISRLKELWELSDDYAGYHYGPINGGYHSYLTVSKLSYMRGLVYAETHPVAASQEGQEELWRELIDMIADDTVTMVDGRISINPNKAKQHFEIKRKV